MYPCKPKFYYIKVGCKGVFVTRTGFRDELSVAAVNLHILKSKRLQCERTYISQLSSFLVKAMFLSSIDLFHFSPESFTASHEYHMFPYVSKHNRLYSYSFCLLLIWGKSKKCLTCVLVLVSNTLLNIIPMAFPSCLLARNFKNSVRGKPVVGFSDQVRQNAAY